MHPLVGYGGSAPAGYGVGRGVHDLRNASNITPAYFLASGLLSHPSHALHVQAVM